MTRDTIGTFIFGFGSGTLFFTLLFALEVFN